MSSRVGGGELHKFAVMLFVAAMIVTWVTGIWVHWVPLIVMVVVGLWAAQAIKK